MQIQTARVPCFLSNTHRTGGEQFQPDPDVNSIYFTRHFSSLVTTISRGRLHRNGGNEFSAAKFHLGRLDVGEEIFCKSTHAGILYIYISPCPRFHEPGKKKKRKERERKGSEQTPGIIFLIPLFSPSSVSGRILRNSSELLIHSAFDLYGLSLLSNYARDLSF